MASKAETFPYIRREAWDGRLAHEGCPADSPASVVPSRYRLAAEQPESGKALLECEGCHTKLLVSCVPFENGNMVTMPSPGEKKPPQSEKSAQEVPSPATEGSEGKELIAAGYKVETAKGTDKAGNEIQFTITSPRGTSYFIKKTKAGKLRAYRGKDDTTATFVSDYYAFEAKNGKLFGRASDKPTVTVASEKKAA